MRDQVAWLYKAAAARGLIVGSSGNVSARTSDGMVITPSGGDPETVTAADLAGVTLDGEALNDATPSSEWAMHAAIYRTCPAAAFVVHTHADACTALACLGRGCRRFITWWCSSAARTCVARLMSRSARRRWPSMRRRRSGGGRRVCWPITA